MRTLRNIFASEAYFAAGESKRLVKPFNYNAADAASIFLVLFVYIMMRLCMC